MVDLAERVTADEVPAGYRMTELGQLPQDWLAATLGEVGTLKDGDWILREDYASSGVRLLQVGDIGHGRFIDKSSRCISPTRAQELKCTLLQPSDILISRMADPVGRCCILPILPYPTITAVDVTIFRCNCAVGDHDYLSFAINSPATIAQSESMAYGVTRKRITRKNLEKVIVPLPPLAEQRAIVHVLSTVQRAIVHVLSTVQRAREATEAVIAATRELKRSLMRHLFTHGPVPVDQVGGMRLKETDIGVISDQWDVHLLGDVARVSSGGTPDRSRPEFWNGDIPWVKTGEINYNVILTTEERISWAGLNGSSARIVPVGTILMAMYGQGVTRGRVAKLGIEAAINQACLAISPHSDVATDFLYHYLAHRYEAIRELGHGANQKNLNAAMVKSIPVPLPTVAEQELIATTLDNVDSKIDYESGRMAILDALFASLLDALLSGSVRACAQQTCEDRQ